MMDYLGRGMDATAYTLPTFMRFDAKMLNAVAKLIGQGEEWPTSQDCVRTAACVNGGVWHTFAGHPGNLKLQLQAANCESPI